MRFGRPQIYLALFVVNIFLMSNIPQAQEPHDHSKMAMPMDGGWQLMQDGIVFAEFNHQGGPRGGDEFVVPNWWMGMASRKTARGQLTFTGMLSLDPATVGKAGYREIFQAGEALDGRPLIDRQHPHDLFMQLAAVWRMPVSESTGFTLAGGPVGEPALGPVAFMHRASAADNPTAPLGHHTFDSTHIAFGVVTAAVDHGPVVVEGSLFNGREPDENRWDFDFGRLDSFSGRVWYRPNDEWELQASSGRLKNPEELEPGDVVRSTVSAAWTRRTVRRISAVTAGFGRNNTDHGTRNAFFAEGSRHLDMNTWYGRCRGRAGRNRAAAVGRCHQRRSSGGQGSRVRVHAGRGPRCPGVAWLRRRLRCGRQFLWRARLAATQLFRAPRLVPRVLPPETAGRRDGTDVEYADVTADGRSPDAGNVTTGEPDWPVERRHHQGVER